MRVVGTDSSERAFAEFLVPLGKDFRVIIGARCKKFVGIGFEFTDEFLPLVGIRCGGQQIVMETFVELGIGVSVADFHAGEAVAGRVVAFLDV